MGLRAGTIPRLIAWGLPLLMMLLSACADATEPRDGGEKVASVVVTPTQSNLEVGDTLRLAAVARTAAGRPLEGRTFTWTSEDTMTAVVSASGLVTGRAPGLVEITAATGGKKASAELQVIVTLPPTPAIASMEPTSIQAGWGAFTLVVKGTGFTPFSRVRFKGQPLETFPVGPTELRASVSASLVAAEGPAAVQVETSYPEPVLSNQLTFTVHARPASSIELQVAGTALFVENTLRLDAIARDPLGQENVGNPIEWTTTDSALVQIYGASYVRGLRPGTATLIASAYPVSRTLILRVLEAPAADVIFESAPNNVPEIFIRSLAPGGGVRRILPFGTLGMQPAPSPDGRRIAFVGVDSLENLDIYVVNTDGSMLRRLTSANGQDTQPAWSPDGTRIAFASVRDGKSDIWVMNADGSGARNLTFQSVWLPEEHNERPVWSPDGTRIAFGRGFGIGQSIYTVAPGGGSPTELVRRAGASLAEPVFSHDGTLLLYRRTDLASGFRSLEFASAYTGEPTYVNTTFPADPATPAWLTEGWVAVSARALPGSTQRTIALVRLSGGESVVPLASEYGTATNPKWIRR